MPDTSHEIPTHLQVEDKPLLGLSARQLAYLLAGASAAYALWQQGAGLPSGPRAGLAAACLLVAAAVALVRPLGRGLDEWAVVVLRAAAVPRRSRWRPREPAPPDREPGGAAWAEFAPHPGWLAPPVPPTPPTPPERRASGVRPPDWAGDDAGPLGPLGPPGAPARPDGLGAAGRARLDAGVAR